MSTKPLQFLKLRDKFLSPEINIKREKACNLAYIITYYVSKEQLAKVVEFLTKLL